MRRVVIVMLVCLAATGCAESTPGGGGASPQATASPEAPAELPGASCRNVNAGNPANLPDFVAVDLESAEGNDRITFRFEPLPDAPNAPPFHVLSFVDELATEGEGAPVEVEGDAFLLVSFQAIGVDLSGEEPREVYTGPKRFTPDFGTVLEVAHLGDFEGQVSWGVGLSRRACFVLDAGQDHLTLSFPSS
jgi:hypothetical protein